MHNNPLKDKNNFVVALRDHLMLKYITKKYYTYHNSNSSEDLSGFCLRRNLCLYKPSSAEEVLSDVYSYIAENYGKDNLIAKEGRLLVFKLNNLECLVTSYIGQGHDGDISVDVIKSPSYSIKKMLSEALLNSQAKK